MRTNTNLHSKCKFKFDSKFNIAIEIFLLAKSAHFKLSAILIWFVAVIKLGADACEFIFINYEID